MATSGKNQGGASPKPALRVLLANPRGFCAGVERAIEIVERALHTYATPVYVRHEIVHNKRVVETLRAKGAHFVEEVDEIPEGAVTVFSAHGVSQKVIRDAEGRRLDVIDATCPLVCKVHKEGQRYASMGYEVVLVGHRGHPEVEGTMGQIRGKVHLVTCVAEVERLEPADPEKLAYVTQTTLSVDDTRDIIEALTRRFPKIKGPDLKDICYATQNRQTAVRELAAEADVILVVGSQNSSNSNRLGEIGASMDVPTYLVEEAGVLRPEWFRAGATVGITAGASAPEELVREIIDRLDGDFEVRIETLPGAEEHVQFPLPEKLIGADEITAAPPPAHSR